jgi:hypothetical protein
VNNTATGFFVQRNAFSTRAKTLGFYLEKEGLTSFLLFPSKKHPPLIPFVQYELEYTNSTGINSIKRFDIVSQDTSWCANPQRLAVAYFLCEVVYQTCEHRHFDLRMDRVLKQMEKKLATSESLFQLPIEFLCQWMDVLGYLPEPIDAAAGFDVTEGVFLREAMHSTQGAKAWNNFLLAKPTADKNELREAFQLILHYLRVQIPNFDVSRTLLIIQQIFH